MKRGRANTKGITVGKLKEYLQSALEDCEQYDDNEPIRYVTNTYFLDDCGLYLGIRGLGFVNLENIEPKESEEDESEEDS